MVYWVVIISLAGYTTSKVIELVFERKATRKYLEALDYSEKSVKHAKKTLRKLKKRM